MAHNFSEEVEYIQGRKLSLELMQVLSLNGWKHSDLATIFKKFYEYLLQFKINPGQSHPPIFLVGRVIDLLPKNTIIDANKNLHKFDCDWESESNVDVRQVLFRSVLSLGSLSILAPDQNGRNHSVKSLFLLVCDLLKIKCDEALFREFSQTCVEIQREISDYAGSIENFSEFAESRIGRRKFEPNLIVQMDLERDSAVAERDSAVVERDSAVVERDSAVAERDSAVAERDSLVNSNTWKIFGIYRKLKSGFDA